MYQKKSNKQYFKDKIKTSNKISSINKIKLLLGLKCFSGILYVKAKLKKIELAKELFTLEI